MIKIYCDWCKRETEDCVGGAFARRVAMTENGGLNVILSLEFSGNSKPEHICVPCFAERIITATQKLKAQVSMAHA